MTKEIKGLNWAYGKTLNIEKNYRVFGTIRRTGL